MTKPVYLRLLGSLEVVLDAQTPPALRRKTRALLGYLALQNGPVSRHKLAAWFCQMANDPTRALNLLLSRLRSLHPNLIVRSDDAVQLNTELVTTDVQAFLAALDSGVSPGETAQLATVVGLYRGELLDGLTLTNASAFELWLLAERTRMRRLYERGLLALLDQHVAAGHLDEGIQVGQRLLQSDPLNEVAQGHLMWLYVQNGQREAALQQYAQCKTLLANELAVAPSEQIETLYMQIREQRTVTQLSQRPTTALSAANPVAPSFVGREMEKQQLREAWAKRAPNPVLISGRAGSGKSRLLAWFSAEVPATQQHQTRCYESTTALPYQPWRDLIEAEVETWDAAQFGKLPSFVRTGLLRLLPHLGTQLGAAASPSSGDATQLFAAVRQFFQILAKTGPQLVAIDDMQWADVGSLSLFHYLARTAARDGLLLLMVYRSESAEKTPALQRLLRDLHATDAAHITLNPLGVQDVEQLLSSQWPRLPQAARGAAAKRLAEASGGNPFFLTEMLRDLRNCDALPTQLPLPARINQRVQQQLAQLASDTKQVVETVAILAGPVPFSTIEACSGRGERACSTGLDQAVQNGLVSVDEAGRYQISHDILREATVQQTDAGRQLLLHRRAARHLAQRASVLAVQPQAAADLLHHAMAGEAHDLIFLWAHAAASSTLRVYAYAETERFAEAGIAAFANQLELGTNDAASIHLLVDLLLVWARAHFFREFDGKLMQSRLTQIAQLLDRHRDAKREAELLHAQAAWHMRSGQLSRMAEKALAAYEQFVVLEAWPLAMEALQTAATAKISTSQNHAGLMLYERALALAVELDSAESIISCRNGLAWTHINLGQIEAALQQLEAALDNGALQHNMAGRSGIYFTMAAAWCMYEDAEKTRHYAQEAAACYREVGSAFMRTRCALYLANADINEGRFDDAEQVLRIALSEAEQMSDNWMVGWAAQQLGRLALRRGAFDEAHALLMQAYDLRQAAGALQNQVSDLSWLGRLALAQRQVDEAVDLTTRAIAQWERFSAEFYVFEMPDVWMAFSEALTAAGRHDEAATAVEHAHETLSDFASQITDTAVRSDFLQRPNSLYVLRAANKMRN